MATPRDCPKCGIVNPPAAHRCDCGYEFINPVAGGAPTTSSPRKPLIVEAIQWWARDPWPIAWSALAIALPLIAFNAPSGYEPCGWSRVFFERIGERIGVVFWVLLLCCAVSFAQGVRITWPRSKARTVSHLAVATGLIWVVIVGAGLFAGFQPRDRIAKAQADMRALQAAIDAYTAHVQASPPTLDSLTSRATNTRGQTAGPFMAFIPHPPNGWRYRYEVKQTSGYSLTMSGDCTTLP